MPSRRRIGPRDYYNVDPPLENAVGDIWSELPVHGLLGEAPLPGIVISPACDLLTRKVETVTYLPVIPVRAYFSTVGFLPDALREIDAQLNAAGLTNPLASPSHFFPPAPNARHAARRAVQDALRQPRIAAKQRAALDRAQAGLDTLEYIAKTQLAEIPSSTLRSFLGDKNWRSILRRISRNSYSLDLHFLPADEQPSEWSGVPTHSVVLFRYAFTGPVELFERAQDIHLRDWKKAVDEVSSVTPGAHAFSERRPMKRLSLRPSFVSDLITRYVGLYVRLGSPDFTDETVDRFVDTIGFD